jgi:membrane-associated PAP2 superfamily phosphatase
MKKTDGISPLRAGRDWIGSHPVADAVAFIVVVSLFFHLFPDTDAWFSRLFYVPGAGFPATDNILLIELRRIGNELVWALAIGAGLSLAACVAFPGRRTLLHPNAALFLVATFAIGPGLIVRLLLKDNWGRPRPYMTDLFGGHVPYVDVWRMSDYCTGSCSFVSSEASTAIWLLAVALVAPLAWRRRALVAAGILTLALSLNRIAFGAHFLSDVVLAWAVMAIVIAACYRLILVKPVPMLDLGAVPASFEEFQHAILTGTRRHAAWTAIGHVAVTAAALGGLAFALAGQSTWPIARGMHERVEAIGHLILFACIGGLIWYAIARGRAPSDAPGEPKPMPLVASVLFKLLAAVGVAAQFGSITVTLAAAVAVVASLPLTIIRHTEAARRSGVMTLRVALATSAVLLLSIPVAEGLERLQAAGLLHVAFHLP